VNAPVQSKAITDRLMAEAYGDVVATVDAYFGMFSIVSLVLALFQWWRGAGSGLSVVLIIIFIVFNLASSQLNLKAPLRYKRKLEAARILFNGFFCIAFLKFADGAFSPWWEPFLIPTLGAVMILSLSSHLVSLSLTASFYFPALILISSVIFPDALSIQQAIIYALTTLMVALICRQITVILARSLHREAGRAEELDRAMAQLQAAEHQLIRSERVAALGEMASGVAHEINNPLAILQLNAGVIRRVWADFLRGNRDMPAEAIEQAITQIESTCQRIGAITHGLRQFARNADDDRVEHVDVRNIVDDTLLLCQQKFIAAGVKLEVRSEQERPLMVNCRRVQISQALFNLMENALTASSRAATPWVRIGISATGHEISLSVTDSGPGIPVASRPLLFQPFFTTKPSGTGLGLSVARDLVAANRAP
jgi:signal transduction histidine kinase